MEGLAVSDLALAPTVSHFWVARVPGGEVSLLLSPPPVGTLNQHHIEIRDSRGELSASDTLILPSDGPGKIALDPLLGFLKPQAGIEHGHLVVRSDFPAVHACRFRLHRTAFNISHLERVCLEHGTFFPVICGGSRGTFLCAVSNSEDTARIRVRLFLPNRSPETDIDVAPQGSLCVSIDEIFSSCLREFGDREQMGYLRMSSLHRQGVLVQLLERVQREQSSEPIWGTVQ